MEIRLVNTRTYKDAVIELPDEGGFVVVTGESDSGKSNIVRALGKLFYNTGSNSSTIKSGEDDCEIAFEFPEGVVSRIISKTENAYVMQVGGSRTQRFSAGRGVPDDVSTLLQCGLISTADGGSTSINIRGQHDNKFLVGSTPGQRARVLMSLADFDIFDKSAKLTSKYLRAVAADKKNTQKQIESLRESIEALPPEGVVRELIQQLTSLSSSYNETVARYKKVTHIHTVLSDTELQSVRDIIQALAERIDSAVAKIEDYKICASRYDRITSTKKVLEDVSKQEHELGHIPILSKLVVLLQKELDDLAAVVSQYDQLYTLSRKIAEVKSELRMLEPDISIVKNQLTDIQHEKTRALKMLGKCPVCGKVTA